MLRLSLLGFATVALVAVSCSVVNAPDDAADPDGSGASTGGTPGTGGSIGGAGGSGGAPECETVADCNAPPCQMASACDDGACTFGNVPNDTPCEEELFCSTNDLCQDGACVAGPDPTCTSTTACDTVTCDEAAAMCVTSTITACAAGDGCCPAGCSASTDTDCLYWATGVQQNVEAVDLSGWTQCHQDFYSDFGVNVAGMLATSCIKSKLLLACRPIGSPTLTLLAMAERADVLFDCGTQVNCTQQANGVGFYYSDQYSWGFAPGGEPVNRSSCDYNDGTQTQPELRMCWHTYDGNFEGGYRCGSNDLNGANNWERLVFHAD